MSAPSVRCFLAINAAPSLPSAAGGRSLVCEFRLTALFPLGACRQTPFVRLLLLAHVNGRLHRNLFDYAHHKLVLAPAADVWSVRAVKDEPGGGRVGRRRLEDEWDFLKAQESVVLET